MVEDMTKRKPYTTFKIW